MHRIYGTANDAPKRFVEALAALDLPNVFNPYCSECRVHDMPGAAAIRRMNLENAIAACLKSGVDSIWIARDLGHRGGRRTGLALTDDIRLADHARMLGLPSFERATHGEPMSERTATVIWDELGRLKRPVFLWNVFPLHPFDGENHFSNRKHKRLEAELCRGFIEWLVASLTPKRVIAIGQDAQNALHRMSIESAGVRHPSYGGEREFRAGIAHHYGC